MSRILVGILCAGIGAGERWLLGQTTGDIVVSGLVLGVGFILCSPYAGGLQSHLKIAALLVGFAVANDVLALAITSLIDGNASLAGGNWMIPVIVTWIVLNRPKVSRWVGLKPTSDGAAHG